MSSSEEEEDVGTPRDGMGVGEDLVFEDEGVEKAWEEKMREEIDGEAVLRRFEIWREGGGNTGLRGEVRMGTFMGGKREGEELVGSTENLGLRMMRRKLADEKSRVVDGRRRTSIPTGFEDVRSFSCVFRLISY